MITRIPSNYLIDTAIEHLGESYTKLYDKRIGTSDVRTFLFNLLVEVFMDEKTGQQKNINELYAYYRRVRFRKTKRNWLQSIQNSLGKSTTQRKELLGEIDWIQEGIDRFGLAQFKTSHKISSIEEFTRQRLQEIEEWVKDDNQRLIDYTYINDKTTNQIQTALHIDAVMCISKIVVEEFGGEFTSIVREVNDFINDFALPGKTIPARFGKSVTFPPKDHQVDEYSIGNDLKIQTFIRNDLDTGERLTSLDPKDFEIFRYVLSRRDIEFVERQKIFVDIGDIVKAVYSSKGKKSYELVEKRLAKLRQITFHVIDKNGDKIIFGLFDSVKIINYESGGTRAEITVPESIHQVYIDNQVTKIYSDKIKNFQLALSESMAFALQKERFHQLLKVSNAQKTFSYPYEFFARRLRFPSRKKESNLKLIEQCLQEIMDNQVTIESYSRKGDVFQISFLEVSTHEAEDLIEANFDTVQSVVNQTILRGIQPPNE